MMPFSFSVEPLSEEERLFEEERLKFERWMNPGGWPGNMSQWIAPGRYDKESHQMAWLGWMARARLAAEQQKSESNG